MHEPLLSFATASAPRPRRSITPGRKFSIRTSAPVSKRSKTARALGLFRSSATLFLLRHCEEIRTARPAAERAQRVAAIRPWRRRCRSADRAQCPRSRARVSGRHSGGARQAPRPPGPGSPPPAPTGPSRAAPSVPRSASGCWFVRRTRLRRRAAPRRDLAVPRPVQPRLAHLPRAPAEPAASSAATASSSRRGFRKDLHVQLLGAGRAVSGRSFLSLRRSTIDFRCASSARAADAGELAIAWAFSGSV